MSDEDLARYLTDFLRTATAKRICRSYRVEPEAALTVIFIRLRQLAAGVDVQKPTAWVRAQAIGCLRTYLRRDERPLRQTAKAPSAGNLCSLAALTFDPSSGSETGPDDKDRSDLLEREMRRLPARERRALAARAGLSQESCRSVARRYGVSHQTAYNWAANGAAKLRRRLEGCL